MKKQQNDQKFEVRTEGYSSGGPMKEEIITFTILWDLPNDSRMSHHIQRKVHHWLLSYWAVYRYFSAAGGTDCTRLSGDPPSSQGISWGWRQQERYVKLKLQKTAFLLYSNHFRFHQSAHIYILSTALILLKSCVDKVFLFFFSHALPKFKVRPVTPDCRVKAD